MTMNSTSFKPGNKMAQKSPKIVVRKFNQMLENAKNDDEILCFQDACMSVGWRSSKVAYWTAKLPVFENLKKEISAIITARINKNALRGDFNATASIWRMKMLGESEVNTINHQNNGGSFEPPKISFSE